MAAAAVAWLAASLLMPRPPVPEPGRRLAAAWAVTILLINVKLAAGLDGLRVGAWASVVLACGLVVLAVRRPPSARAKDLGHA